MKEGWEYKKLGEVATFINGDRGRNYPSQNDFVESGVPFINAGHLNNGVIDFESMNYISNEKYNSLNSGKIKEGDILFCLRGSLGKSAIVKSVERGAIASSLVIIRSKNVFNQYLYYYLDSQTIARQIKRNNNGSSQPNLSAKSVSNFILPIPPLAEQERIVAELDLLSSIIDKKKAQLKELDQLAQSIFYTMFGDPITNEKCWEVKKMGEIGTIVGGSTPSTNDDSNWDGTINWVTPAELGEQLYYGETIRKLTEMGARGLTMMPAGTVLLSSRAPIGKLAITTTPMCSNQGFKNIICDKIINNVFLYYYLKNTMDLVKALGRGATFKEVSKSAISSFKVILPPLPLQQEFASKIEAIERQKSLIQQSIVETQTLFDSRMEHWFN